MDASILDNIALHIDINKEEANHFLSLLEYKSLNNKEILLQAGTVCRTINFVVNGCIRMYTTDEGGKEHNVLFAPENWWCTDLFSFHTNSPSTHSIEALEETKVAQLTHQNLEKLCLDVPKFERFFRVLFQNGFIMYQNRINSELSLPADQKYKSFKKLYPGLNQRIAQKHIASYLGITPVFLSMLRKKYNDIN
ncbi:hypothetical protein AMR72_02675 [Flavobacterium psychrophilum]|nr:hypothetical protein AMR72_02675 [Flavobacterium psychrophilum]AOE51516.1 hypothetical protein ALW18_02675 [Flavobacterium psychrophilum]